MNAQDLRIRGVYEQAQEGRHMLRVKLPGGLLTIDQALGMAELSERVAGGVVHLTTRMSLELHDLDEDGVRESLASLPRMGLTSRGACGGAVRGVSVSGSHAPGAGAARALATAVQTHFTGDPTFEGLPKKFKVGVDAGYQGSRCRIQDVGVVWIGRGEAVDSFDLWIAGGLGRHPREGFLFEHAVHAGRAVAVIEATIRVYKAHAAPGRRLKHLAAELGREELVRRIRAEISSVSPAWPSEIPPQSPPCETALLARVFAGELQARRLRVLSEAAAVAGSGVLILTPDQDVTIPLTDPSHRNKAAALLAAAGFGGSRPEDRVVIRVCPGSHQCRLGLAPTRDVARKIVATMCPGGASLTWAISGCPNSCSQPQLADVGIVSTRLERDEHGVRQARFDLLRRKTEGFGEHVLRRVSLEDLLDAVRILT